MMSISFPGESPEYRTARNRLLQQEVELRRVTEAVAAARRGLPPGGIVPQDYIFQHAGPEGTPTNVRFSELFERGNDTLVVYNFMFPRALDDERPCPSCTSFLDAFDGAALHISQRINLVGQAAIKLLIETAAPEPASRRSLARSRRWWRLPAQTKGVGCWFHPATVCSNQSITSCASLGC